MTLSVDAKFHDPIKKGFYSSGEIPPEGRTFAALSQCLIEDKELRTNIAFVRACIEVNENLLKFADKKVQREIIRKASPTKLEPPAGITLERKRPSPSVAKKVEEVTKDLRVLEFVKRGIRITENSS